MSSSRKVSALVRLITLSMICAGTKAQTAPEKPAAKSVSGKHYSLPANKDTVQWGWFDPTEKPKLVVDSGDTVSIETWSHGMDEVKPGIILHLKPFPGTIAVGPDPNEPKEKAGPPIHDAKGRTSTLRPWKNGSNMDVNETQVGSTLYFPVFQKGGLIWTGDSHCLQGNGEVNLTELEFSYKEIEIKPIVRKDMHIEWPRVETSTDWVFMGFDEDLNEAMKIAVRETVNFLAEQKMVPMSREEAYALTSIVGDCRVSQVVDIRKGVHCMIPKSIFVKK